MPGKVIAVVNMKGGVGKTATVVSLADALAAKSGSRILVVDVDTQATASYCLAGNDVLTQLIEKGQTIDQFLLRAIAERDASVRLADFVRAGVSNTRHARKQLNISLIASSTILRASEREVVRRLTERHESLTAIEQRLSRTLRSEVDALADTHRYIIVDCAPGISPFTTAAVGIADLVIVPTIPDAPSFLGLAAFLGTVHQNTTHDSARRLPHVLLTRYAPATIMAWLRGTRSRGRLNHQAEYRQRIIELSKHQAPAFKLLKSVMSETPLMPHALSLGADNPQAAPTFAQKYPDKLGRELDKLADEIMEVLT